MDVRMEGSLALINLYGRFTRLVLCHASSVAFYPDPR